MKLQYTQEQGIKCTKYSNNKIYLVDLCVCDFLKCKNLS